MATLRERLVKIGGKIGRHGRSITCQPVAEMLPRAMFHQIPTASAALCPPPSARC